VGSAQVRRDGAVLQHGSLLLDFDAALYLSLFLHRDTLSPEELGHRVVSLREALGRDVRYAEVGTALREGFQRALGVELAPGELSPEERRVAEELAANKYGTAAWNLAR